MKRSYASAATSKLTSAMYDGAACQTRARCAGGHRDPAAEIDRQSLNAPGPRPGGVLVSPRLRR